jgi:hypothetical protein
MVNRRTLTLGIVFIVIWILFALLLPAFVAGASVSPQSPTVFIDAGAAAPIAYDHQSFSPTAVTLTTVWAQSDPASPFAFLALITVAVGVAWRQRPIS